MKKKIFITGNKGFIGTHLTSFLTYDYDVSGCDIKSGSDLFHIYSLKGFDIVIHLAALTNVRESFKQERDYVRTNILGTAHIIRLCLDEDIKLIHLSSAAADDHTSSPYAFTKAIGEKMVTRLYEDLHAVVFHPYNIYGPNPPKDSLFYNFLNQPQLTVYGDGTDSRDFMNIIDLCKIIKSAVDNDWQSKEPIAIGTGKAHTLKEIATLFNKYGKKKIIYGKSKGGIHTSKADITLLREFYKKNFTTDLEADIKTLLGK